MAKEKFIGKKFLLVRKQMQETKGIGYQKKQQIQLLNI